MKQSQQKKWKSAIGQFFLTGFVLIAVFLLLSWLVSYVGDYPDEVQNRQGYSEQYPALSEQIWEYRPLVEKYAEQYGVAEHVSTILAMMMQESGGRGNDPMQSSESLCGEIGCIDDPERSIEQGVSFFALSIENAEGDVELAVQAYNFGQGFIQYIEEEQEGYSEEAAIAFSQKMYQEAGKEESIYSCRRAEAEELEACYGDIYYVPSVMSYKQAIEAELEKG
ncbi:lysozyme family protein [Gracilibacillus alcaliphilus]|uniref:lysozyme family protein n=1 Tax=Gracilibacillus alcaliphilus TaxID=1401441 RepID=UPI001956A630|nr:lysozyme family protein [Gracilibacillus alcaliphilus]MBM7677397.1 hypothetical protein [Gracilibacillus alcaliphilus]